MKSQFLCALLTIMTAVMIGLSMPLNSMACLLVLAAFGLLNGWWIWTLYAHPGTRH